VFTGQRYQPLLRRAQQAQSRGRRHAGKKPVFFLLDEILHGTNSLERQIGARWVIGELMKRGVLGAVSTHDMGLAELEPALNEPRDPDSFPRKREGQR